LALDALAQRMQAGLVELVERTPVGNDASMPSTQPPFSVAMKRWCIVAGWVIRRRLDVLAV
jgi:hypothetical protein